MFSCRMLQSLLSADGVNPAMITVFIDGYFEVSNLHHSFCSEILVRTAETRTSSITFRLCSLQISNTRGTASPVISEQ